MVAILRGPVRRMRRVLPLLLLLALALPAALLAPDHASRPAAPPVAQADAAQQTRARALLAALPLAFEENRGQSDPAVRFLAHARTGSLLLTPDALTLAFAAHDATRDASVAAGRDRYSVRFAFVGADPAPTLTAERPLPGVVNYFVGNDPARWQRDVPTSARIRYAGLYPGLDLVVYGDAGGQWEYDVEVAPGADPGRFALRMDGAQGVTLEGDGALAVQTGTGTVRAHAPVAYQEVGGGRRAVDAGYALRADGTMGFAVGAYDQALPLVIDPLVYSTYLGGDSSEVSHGIAVDASGNAYITGQTSGANFPTTPGAFQTISGGGGDAFVTKLNATGSALLYSTFLGGYSSDSGTGIAVDASGNAYITGQTSGANFPTTPGAFQTTPGSGSAAFVTKLNASGSALLYSTFLGDVGASGAGIAVDASGNAYVTGTTITGSPFPTTPGAFQAAYGGGGGDAFVTKLNATGGALLYSTFLGGGGGYGDSGTGIAVDGGGNAYVTGTTSGADFPTTPGAFQTTYRGFTEAFVTRVNAAGSALVYSTFLGGNGSDSDESFGGKIAVDGSGNAYVTGSANADFPTTPGAFQPTFGGSFDAFVTKLSTGASAPPGPNPLPAPQPPGPTINGPPPPLPQARPTAPVVSAPNPLPARRP